MHGNKAVSNVEFKGSFYPDMIIRYLNVRPLLRSVEFSKGHCHLLILERHISRGYINRSTRKNIQVVGIAHVSHRFVDYKRSGRESESLPDAP